MFNRVLCFAIFLNLKPIPPVDSNMFLIYFHLKLIFTKTFIFDTRRKKV